MINRRDLFKGAGAFLGAASAYKASEAGVLLPYDKIITAPVPPWAGKTQVIAFEGMVSSFRISANTDESVTTAIDGRMFDAPIILEWSFMMMMFLLPAYFQVESMFKSFRRYKNENYNQIST